MGFLNYMLFELHNISLLFSPCQNIAGRIENRGSREEKIEKIQVV